jgi:hypothetical protein
MPQMHRKEIASQFETLPQRLKDTKRKASPFTFQTYLLLFKHIYFFAEKTESRFFEALSRGWFCFAKLFEQKHYKFPNNFFKRSNLEPSTFNFPKSQT